MIYRTMLSSKIQHAIVTDANVDYEGSIAIDTDLLEAVDILEHEQVQVVSLTTGVRLETYAIAANSGSGEVCINGAAAKLIHKGEKIIIMTYAAVASTDIPGWVPKVVRLDSQNRIESLAGRQPAADLC